MKKLLSLVLALALVLTFAVSAFATQVEGTIDGANDNKLTENVRVWVHADETPVYRVTLQWDDLDFEYELGKWNTVDHRYASGEWKPFTAGGQTGDATAVSSDIVITNHSNRDITVSAALSDEEPWNGATASLAQNSATVIDYVVEAQDNEVAPVIDSHTIKVNVTGDPKSTTDTFKIAKVTVTLEGSVNQLGAPAADNDAKKSLDWQTLNNTSYVAP